MTSYLMTALFCIVNVDFTVYYGWTFRVVPAFSSYGECYIRSLQCVNEEIHVQHSEECLPHSKCSVLLPFLLFSLSISAESFLAVELRIFLEFWYISPNFHAESPHPHKWMRMLFYWALPTMYSIFIFILAPLIGKKLYLIWICISLISHEISLLHFLLCINRFIYFGEIKILFISFPIFQSRSSCFSYWFVSYFCLCHVGVFLPIYHLPFNFSSWCLANTSIFVCLFLEYGCFTMLC